VAARWQYKNQGLPSIRALLLLCLSKFSIDTLTVFSIKASNEMHLSLLQTISHHLFVAQHFVNTKVHHHQHSVEIENISSCRQKAIQRLNLSHSLKETQPFHHDLGPYRTLTTPFLHLNPLTPHPFSFNFPVL
jgi:hypothetical protein